MAEPTSAESIRLTAHGQRASRLAALSLAVLLSVAGAAFTVEAREGFFLGAGLAQQSATGDLDGTHVFVDSSGTVAAVDGKLSNGGGVAIDLGYGFNKYVGVELMSAATSNMASTPGIPDSKATVSSALLGLRLTYPASRGLDLFARAGISTHSVAYPNHVFHGTLSGSTFVPSGPGQDSATFTGSGTGVGIGAEVFMGHIGLALGVTHFSASLDQLSTGGSPGSLPKALNETFTLGDLTVAYHF